MAKCSPIRLPLRWPDHANRPCQRAPSVGDAERNRDGLTLMMVPFQYEPFAVVTNWTAELEGKQVGRVLEHYELDMNSASNTLRQVTKRF
jgi:hypothetical protein